MTVEQDIRRSFVVAVNEYPSGAWNVGHINLTFIDHGNEIGTYGLNSQGYDLKGRRHAQGRLAVTMPGGVFKERHDHAMTHYVIVSRSNYMSMLAYAQSQARITTDLPQTYGIFTNNCSDFAYRVFSHSDLPEKYRNIAAYLRNLHEPAAIYTIDVAELYSDKFKRSSPADQKAAHDHVARRLVGDGMLYWPPLS